MHRSPAALQCDDSLIESLMDPGAFNHPADELELLETHISWLILAGDYAYKIKKPLKLDFLDFSDLDKRKFYCKEEIRLNAPWAPGIYIDVVPVVVADGKARIGGDGEPVEYAVRMHRFDQSARLDSQLSAGRLSVADMKLLAAGIAERHLATDRVPPERREHFLQVTRELMLENFSALADVLDDEVYAGIRAWTLREIDALGGAQAARFDDGYVRSCHGDLHLGNLVRTGDTIATYDCIEFNTDLRHIDVMCDVAFLAMDLMARGSRDLASHFLNRYLEVTGDYEGMTVFNLYFVYRCLVRSKVAVIRSSERVEAQDREDDIDEAVYYCELACRQIADREPVMILMHGLSGAGKTRVSAGLMAALPAIRIRSDLERKRLAGVGETQSSASDVGSGIYSGKVDELVYARLQDRAATILASGHNVIVDAANLRQWQRQAAVKTAGQCGCNLIMIDVSAPVAVLEERLAARAADRSEASEADIGVLRYQLSKAEPIEDSSLLTIIKWDTSRNMDIGILIADIQATINSL